MKRFEKFRSYEISQAHRLGLYLLVERSKRGQPAWRLYGKASGQLVLIYYPCWRRWLGGQGHGEGQAGFRKAFEIAAKLASANGAEQQPVAR